MARPTLARRLVPHVKQSFNWDCGLACSEMTLRALGVRTSACELAQLRRVVPAESIWTVDLAYLLQRFGVRYRFLTTQLGADPAYKDKSFYSATLAQDAQRVNALFEHTDLRHSIEHCSLGSAELTALLQPRDHLIMALVDRRYLYRPAGAVAGMMHRWTAPRANPTGLVRQLREAALRCMPNNGASGYLGHYVLITDYDEARAMYCIADPGKADGPGYVHAADLDSARLAHGTDEDLIIIPWDEQSTLPLPLEPGCRAQSLGVTP